MPGAGDLDLEAIAGDGHGWIKVRRYEEPPPDETDWRAAYERLAAHHAKETTFLIGMCRRLAAMLLASDRPKMG